MMQQPDVYETRIQTSHMLHGWTAGEKAKNHSSSIALPEKVGLPSLQQREKIQNPPLF